MKQKTVTKPATSPKKDHLPDISSTLDWLTDQSNRKTVENGLIILVMIIFVLLRIRLGALRSVQYTDNALFDDYTLLMSADFDRLYQGTPSFLTLIKTLSFPWFLNFAAGFPFSINTVLALFWTVDALLMYALLRQNGMRRGWALFGFAFTLFCPTAFENRSGVQFYRNILLAPTTMFFMTLLGLMFSIAWNRRKTQYWKIWLGALAMTLFFPFAYYIKEDGIWMLGVLAVFTVLILGGLVFRLIKTRKKKAMRLLVPTLISALLLCFPFVNLKMSTDRYIHANEQYLHLPYITLRTDSEFFRFIETMYRLETPDRSLVFWSPKDTFRQAAEVSPTLQNMPEFTDTVLNHSWILQGGEISGDFLGWVMLIALQDLGLYESPEQVNALFGQINAEVDQALQDGRLKKEKGRIYLTSKSAGRKWKEVFELLPDLAILYESQIFLSGYSASFLPTNPEAIGAYQSQEELDDLLSRWSEKLKTDLVTPQDPALANRWSTDREKGARLSNQVFDVYKILIPILFFGGLLIWLLRVVGHFAFRIRYSRQTWIALWLIFLMMGVSFVYGLALVWFTQFIDYFNPAHVIHERILYTLTYYGPGLVGMIYPSILLACGQLFRQKSRKKKSTGKDGIPRQYRVKTKMD